MPTPKFIHLHLHTEYSLVDGVTRIKPLIQTCVNQKIPAIAMTDQHNLFAAVKFFKAAYNAGVKPILGAEILTAPVQNKIHRLVLLCQNKQGYLNLTKLISLAYTKGQSKSIPLVDKAWLRELNQGLIALSAGIEGEIGQALLSSNQTLCQELLTDFIKIYPDSFYLELQRTGKPNEENYNHAAIKFAQEFNVGLVATNNVRFIHREDFQAHEARVCINQGDVLNNPKRSRNYTEEQYLRFETEMLELFADVPESLANTVEIAKRCNVELELGEAYLPAFPTPENLSIEKYLAKESTAGLAKRLQHLIANQKETHPIDAEMYKNRLTTELDVINSMGFSGYFLIVADFIRWAKEQHIPVGPGRGSGAGSLVAYALKITDIDPLEYDLLFERFLNPERISMPDFDIDFCMDGRDRVIDYVAKRYGRASVSQIITFGTMAAKAVVRDVGRVLGHPYGFVDKLAKLIPFELGITLEKALAQEENLRVRYKQEEEVKYLIDLAMKLEGIVRNAGKHAGGVVIAPSALTDFTPLYCEENSEQIVTQFDKDDVEAVGLVKFDFLGLRTLTIINWALKTINQRNFADLQTKLRTDNIPMQDKKTFTLLKACKTTGVFQLESRGMKDLIKRLQPDSFEEIIALVALFRPGPLQSGMVDDFINRKHGRANIEYPHPDLEPILRPTYGVILYQEQVMQIAQVLAGYTLGGADVLRRAMGKKKPEEMAKQRAIFLEGAEKRKVNIKTAHQIFDLMEKFAGYGFNKSHSAAYALISYQTAWLKTNYMAEFMAAVLSSDMDHTDKVVRFIDDCKDLHLKILPPDINRSEYKFSVQDDETILYGLGAIKGVGEAAIESITQNKQTDGAFTDLFEFCQRVDLRKVNKRVLEALIRSGAFDEFKIKRARLFASIEPAIRTAEQHTNSLLSGQNDLFGQEVSEKFLNTHVYVDVLDWSDEIRLQGEKDTLGFYLTGHPIQQYLPELTKITNKNIAKIDLGRNQALLIAGIITAVRTKITKRGDKMAFITIEDYTGRLDLAIFPESYAKYKDFIQKDELAILDIEISIDETSGSTRINANKVYTLQTARLSFAKYLSVRVLAKNIQDDFNQKLQSALKPFSNGSCPVAIEYVSEDAVAHLDLNQAWWIDPNENLLQNLEQIAGIEQIEFCY